MDRANDPAAGAVALYLMGSEDAERVRMFGPQKKRVRAQRDGARRVGRVLTRYISDLCQVIASTRLAAFSILSN